MPKVQRLEVALKDAKDRIRFLEMKPRARRYGSIEEDSSISSSVGVPVNLEARVRKKQKGTGVIGNDRPGE